jgi:hypothetical protein
MKKNSLFLITVLTVLVFGCDETKDFLDELNEAPQINFTLNSDAPLLTDSIKIGLKSSQDKYTIVLKVTDRNKNIREVIYTQLSGKGKLKQGGVEIISNNVTFKNDSAVLEFDYYPETFGLHRLGIKVADNFGLSNSVSLEITAFDNLPPVANISWTKRGDRGKYHYEVRASESFDRDARFGGSIEEYEYKAQGVIHRILSSTENADRYQVIFPDKGVYPIEVRVRDNDGRWSTITTTEIIVD